MLKTKDDIRTKIHLLISVFVVIPVALVYGFYPEVLFQVPVTEINQLNSLKALMGVYLGFSYLWLSGVFSPRFLKAALMSNVVFMLGLGSGRLISLILDGFPSPLFTVGTAGELILGFYGLSVLYNEKK
ncbi:DUF4345 domain-containing protein [Gaetbulibacter aestuarii]|uniref:DUF4345 domain-containing protein n=1 Tax=Gaetbulibacter aestuarii TaxID=1502358 RepID=A0ABW7MUY6_9FLAO